MGYKPIHDLPVEQLREVLSKTKGNVSRTAEALNISRSTLDSIIDRERLRPFLDEIRQKARPTYDISDIPEQEESERVNSEFWRKRFKDTKKELAYVSRMRESLFDLSEPSLKLPRWTAKPHKAGLDIPVLFTSDFQWGEVIDRDEMGGINAFDLRIAKNRYRQLISSTIDICHNFRQGDYPGIIYLRGGDSISGDIHDELQRTNEVPSTGQVLDLFGEELRGIELLAEHFGKVVVISVAGNHGRLTKKPIAKKYAEWNFDHMLSLMLEKACTSKDVTFLTPTSSEAYFQLYGVRFLLTHGDRIGSRGGTGFIGPIATITRGAKKTRDAYATMGKLIDYVLIGHFHTSAWGPGFIANGSLPGYNEYAASIKATPEPPCQTLYFVNKKYGMNEIRRIVLEDDTAYTGKWFES